MGSGTAMVHMNVTMDNATGPLYDVIARIPGTDMPDEWVLEGNHHDAWVHGAADPLSGAAPLMETARTLAEMTRNGWRPKRTIVIAFWDGEEFGLIGSTEWMEKHQDELDQKLVAYINSDSSGGGRFAVNGSHSLEGVCAGDRARRERPGDEQADAGCIIQPRVSDWRAGVWFGLHTISAAPRSCEPRHAVWI